MKIERRYDTDWLRVIAIALLLIYHIAIVFQPWAMLIGFIRSEEISTEIWAPMTMLNVWRIPILFYVSGMGVYFALRKRNNIELLIERTKRILLPFLFGFVAITPLHMFVFQDYYNLGLSYYPHMGHLWFLANIFIYVLIGLPVFYAIKKGVFSKQISFLSRLFSNPLGLLSVNVFFVAEVLILQPKPFEMYAETWHGFTIGLLAFFFGFLFMSTGKVFWNTVKQWKWAFLGLAAILYTLRFVFVATEGPLNEVPLYLISIESNSWIFSIFGFCYQYLNKPSKALSYLSKAAYPVYIIHMVVLYLAAKFILPLHLPAIIAFILITIITFIGCYVLYEFVIRRISILRPLFGLKWKAHTKRKDKVKVTTSKA
ncbi:acyltransferase family protein [Winogradskyella algicola]|uniref:acyltransferase family protein n=1 Tax=Winogradskyella algicola TaxID=2575815 RepID=UPI001109735A|nr:acyltransferase [Winogradskyella algicola]